MPVAEADFGRGSLASRTTGNAFEGFMSATPAYTSVPTSSPRLLRFLMAGMTTDSLQLPL